jgi:hypothetical protein
MRMKKPAAAEPGGLGDWRSFRHPDRFLIKILLERQSIPRISAMQRRVNRITSYYRVSR